MGLSGSRRILVLLLASLIALPAWSVTAASDGRSCKKVGALATDKSSNKATKLVCTKVGKRLVWVVKRAKVTAPAEVGTYSIGDIGPGGGLVFYDAGSEQSWGRYLEAAPADSSSGTVWCNRTKLFIGGTLLAVGTGQANTANILSCCVTTARSADRYISPNGTSDWFLPSRDELGLMYTNLARKGLGGFAGRKYWTSSENSATDAWYRDFTLDESHYVTSGRKHWTLDVRPVRSFSEVQPGRPTTKRPPDQIPVEPNQPCAQDVAPSLKAVDDLFTALKKRLPDTAPPFDMAVHVEPTLINSVWVKDSVASIPNSLRLLQALDLMPQGKLDIFIGFGLNWLGPRVVPPCNDRDIQNSGGNFCYPGVININLKNYWKSEDQSNYVDETIRLRVNSVIPHELFHAAQSKIVLTFGERWGAVWGKTPPWLTEGGAVLFQVMNYALSNDISYITARKIFFGNAIGCGSVSLNTLLDIYTQDQCRYAQGLRATEYLAFKLQSLSVLTDMLRFDRASQAESFEAAYKIGLDTFIREADAALAAEASSN